MKSLRIKKTTVTADRPSGSRVAGALRLSVVAGVLLLCAAVSCKKDEGGEPAPIYGVKTFHASSEGHAGDGKTTLDDKDVFWEEYDEAAVYGDDNENGDYAKYVATEPQGNQTDYYYADGVEVSGTSTTFYAIYPHSAVLEKFGETENGKWKVSLPKYQVGEIAGTFASGANVMAAKSNDLALKFKNLCGVLRLKLKSSSSTTVKVKSIQVVSKNPSDKLWGSGHVTFGEVNGTHALGNLEGGDNGVCLVYPDGVELTADDEGTEFDLVIPAGKLAGGFSLEVYCEWDGGKKGTFFTGTTNASAMIHQNKITVMPVVDVKDYIKEGVLPGRFSVSPTKQVHFSQGNLQFNTTSKIWQFAANQYNRIDVTAGEHHAVGYDDNSGNWIDILGWGTSGHAYGATYYQPWSTDNSNGSLYGPTSATTLTDLSDWGYNPISNGGNVNGRWRTLTGSDNGEWKHLFDGRNSSWTKFAKATVLNVTGLLLFPDGTVGSSVCDFQIKSGNNGNAAYTDNQVDASVWSTLEAAGVVFLPSAGHRYGTSVYNVGVNGNYWSSTAASETSAYHLYFGGSFDPALLNTRCHGFSVRPVLR